MSGFRPHLSTQDTMLLLSEEVTRPREQRLKRAILALDLSKALGNVEHKAILSFLDGFGVGKETHAYIKGFLFNITVEIKIGTIESDILNLATRGTPQGSLLSPFVFNVALILMTARLNQIEGMKHVLHADDITLWTSEGSDAQMEERLQRAADVVMEHAKFVGLSCSPQNSELLGLKEKPFRKGELIPNIRIQIEGSGVPTVRTLKILGMFTQSDGKNRFYIKE